jgi:hypothetical protein
MPANGRWDLTRRLKGHQNSLPKIRKYCNTLDCIETKLLMASLCYRAFALLVK